MLRFAIVWTMQSQIYQLWGKNIECEAALVKQDMVTLFV